MMNWGYTLIRAYRRCVGLRPFVAELITVGRYLYHGNKPISAQSYHQAEHSAGVTILHFTNELLISVHILTALTYSLY